MPPSKVPPAALQPGQTSRQSSVDHFEVSGSASAGASFDAPSENSARRARARKILAENICSFLESVEVDQNAAPKSLLTQMRGAIQPALQVGRKLENGLVETAFRNIKFKPAAKTDERYELSLGVGPIKRSQAEIELHIMLESQFRIAAMVSDNPADNPHGAVDHGDSLAPEFVMEQLAPEFLDAEEVTLDVADTRTVHPGDQTHFDYAPGQTGDAVGDVGSPDGDDALPWLATHSTVTEEVVTLNPIGIPTAGVAAARFDPVVDAENHRLPSDTGSDDEEGFQSNRRAQAPVGVGATIQTPAAEPCTNGAAAAARSTVPVTVGAGGSGPGPVSPDVAHSDHPTYGAGKTCLDSDLIDLREVEYTLFGGKDHSIKKNMSPTGNNCWWRGGILQMLCQFEPGDLQEKLRAKLGSEFEDDITALREMGAALRDGKLSDMLIGMEGKDLATGLNNPEGKFKLAGLTDAEDNGRGEVACKNVMKAVLKKAGIAEAVINNAIDDQRTIHGGDRLIKKFLKQLEGNYISLYWENPEYSRHPAKFLDIVGQTGSGLDKMHRGLSPRDSAHEVAQIINSKGYGVLSFEGVHVNFVFPESILQKARVLEEVLSQ